MLHEYAREHVLLCLVPAFFIAGAISVFVSQASVMKYLGAGASKPVAYGVASVSGSILAACSCTVLPLFAGIYKRGAGLGPAVAFLYSGPAINVLAIVLTARVLGLELGLARAGGAILFSVIIGLCVHRIFRKEEAARAGALMYFATLTEVPILQGLMGAGMGKGPALALLLAGPALSLPNMLVIRGVIGNRKTAAYIGLVVALSTTAGLLYGALS